MGLVTTGLTKRKWQISVSTLLVFIAAIICYFFLVLNLFLASGQTKLTKQLMRLVDVKFSSDKLSDQMRISASLDMSPNCNRWMLETFWKRCGSLAVSEAFVAQGYLPKLIDLITNPCNINSQLSNAGQLESIKLFDCNLNKASYRLTLQILQMNEEKQGVSTYIH